MQTTEVNLPAELEQKADAMQRSAEALLKAAQKLRDAATVLLDASTTNGAPQRMPGRPKKLGMTRVQELKAFVESRGDVSRQEAICESGMPRGTVGALLTRKHGFDQNEDGRWYWPNNDHDSGEE